MVEVLRHLGIPLLVVEQDIERVTALDRQGIATIYCSCDQFGYPCPGHLIQAHAVVVTLPDGRAVACIVVATARTEASNILFIARATTQVRVHRLFALGAQHVIYPELERGLEMTREALICLGYAQGYRDRR